MSRSNEMDNAISDYQIVRELGSGSTGTVYLAERKHDFQQIVAIKVLRWTPVAFSVSQDVEERVILSVLDHPNIVGLLDHGRTADGAPFLVLEYLEGTDIALWCDARRLSVKDRLGLFQQLFSAVTYAHSRLVLHGDIKPSNVLVVQASSANGKPIVKLLDFGISRWMHQQHHAFGTMSATTTYASPEQRRGEALTVAADVFSLGVLLGRLLAGSEPSSADRSKSPMRAPFLKLDASLQREIAAQRNTTPWALARDLRGPLDAIVAKATAPATEDRYASVTAMAADVQRCINNVETSVFPLAKPQQARLWMQRHAWTASLSAMVFAVVIAAGALTLWRHHRVVLQEKDTHARLLELSRLTDDLSGTLYRSTESLAGTEKARASLLRAASAARDSIAGENAQDPQIALELATQYAEAAVLALSTHQSEAISTARRELQRANDLLKAVPPNESRTAVEESIRQIQLLLTTAS